MRKVFFVIFCLTLFFPGISLKSSQDSPRKTFQVFLESMNKFYKEKDQNSLKRAVECLDISKLKGNPQVQGQNAAQKLLEVFDRTELIILKNIPTNVSDSFYIFRKNNSGTIALTKNSQGKWLFNSETISSLDKQLKAVKNNSFVDQSFAHRNTQTKIKLAWVKKLPSIFHQKVFALALWQYIGLFVLLVIGIIIEKLILNFSRSLVLRFLRKQDFSIAEKSVEKLQRPMSLSVLSLIVLNLLEWLTLPLAFNNILLFFANGILAIGLIWVGFVCTEIGEQIFKEITTKTENKIDDLLVPIIARALKILIFIIGFVFLCHRMGLDVTSILAGLGIGGLAFALAAKDTLENIFGSLTVLFDRPFMIGDWVVIGKYEGVIEEVGLRSTRIRTFYNSQISLPNSELIRAAVDNYGRRSYRRFNWKIALTYDTPPEKIEAFCEGIREIIRKHPLTRKDYFMVYLNNMGDYSLQVMVYMFFEVPDWEDELLGKHQVIQSILRLAKQLDVDFAFPTQTFYQTGFDPRNHDQNYDLQGAEKIGLEKGDSALVK